MVRSGRLPETTGKTGSKKLISEAGGSGVRKRPMKQPAITSRFFFLKVCNGLYKLSLIIVFHGVCVVVMRILLIPSQ